VSRIAKNVSETKDALERFLATQNRTGSQSLEKQQTLIFKILKMVDTKIVEGSKGVFTLITLRDYEKTE